MGGARLTPPFRMATSIVPIPGKLVKRIQALEYIDMRMLLPDNIALAERLATLPQGLTPPKPPSEREIGGDRALLTWVLSFATYIAIVAEAHPGRVGDMLAYMRLIIREAGKFGGSGWLTYDSVYRRNQEGSSTPWNTLDASLHQVFIASQGDRITVPCKHCQELDHSPTECAVAAVLPGTTASTPALPSSTVTNPERPSTKGKRPIPYTRQRPICSSWNAGNCKFPGKCTYAHVCINCYGSHPASACREKLYAGPPPAPKQPARLKGQAIPVLLLLAKLDSFSPPGFYVRAIYLLTSKAVSKLRAQAQTCEQAYARKARVRVVASHPYPAGIC